MYDSHSSDTYPPNVILLFECHYYYCCRRYCCCSVSEFLTIWDCLLRHYFRFRFLLLVRIVLLHRDLLCKTVHRLLRRIRRQELTVYYKLHTGSSLYDTHFPALSSQSRFYRMTYYILNILLQSSCKR